MALFNLAALPLKYAIPVIAGLAAGTGAVGAYVSATPAPASEVVAPAPVVLAALPGVSSVSAKTDATEQASPIKPSAKPSCEKEVWPYLDRCITQRGTTPSRSVRVVMASRDGGAVSSAPARELVTSDTVLRGPAVAPEANDQSVIKKQPKRSEQRKQRRNPRGASETAYQVPSARGTQAVVVVHPMRLNTYSSRF